ncbi:hypothetical protein GCM10009525_12920 [Streptosporangium amethystogenes subsp. fukuiense]
MAASHEEVRRLDAVPQQDRDPLGGDVPAEFRGEQREALPAGYPGGDRHLAAQLGTGLGERHVVTGAPGRQRRLHARGTAVDDEDPAGTGTGERRLRPRPPPLPLGADLGVDHAGDRQAALQPPDAALVAGQARAGLVRAALHRLADQVGVGDVRPRQPHQVGLTGGDQLDGLGKAVEPAHREHGQAGEAPLEQCGVVPERRVAEAHVGHLRRQRVAAVVGRVADVHVDERELIAQQPDDLQHVLRRQTAGQELVGADPQAHRQVRRLPGHRGEHLAGEPETPVEVAAVAVGPGVGDRREELLEQVAMAEVDLHPVVPGLRHAAGGRAEGADDRGDVTVSHRVRDVRPGGPRHVGRRPGRGAGRLTGGLPPRVHDLGEDPRSLGVHGLRDLGVGRDGGVVEAAEADVPAGAGGVDPHRLGDDQPHPASGTFQVVGGVPGGRAVVQAEIGGVAGHEHPVAQCHRPQADGREQRSRIRHRRPFSLGGVNMTVGTHRVPHRSGQRYGVQMNRTTWKEQ